MKFACAKLARVSGTLGLAALAAITSPYATAQDAGWYVGASGGPSKATIDDARIRSSLIGGGFQSSTIVDDDRSTGYKLFGGYQFNPNFSLEGGYFDLGKFGFTATTVPVGTLSGNMRVRGLNLDAVGTVPLSEKFSAFGRIGVNYAEATDSFAGTGGVSVSNPAPNKRDTNYKVGVGLQYAFTESLALRTEIERYRVNDAVGNKGDVDHLSIGLVYRFGMASRPQVQPKVALAPEPIREVVAVAPPPQVIPAPPPPAPRFEKYTLAATELFGFDSAELQPPQPKLDEIATALTASTGSEDVLITGYSDRLGATEYNHKLSHRRALAVKGYLAGKGVDANRLIAEGKGEADPAVVCATMKRVELIKCLEPNRRVEIAPIALERRIN
jgi:OOP family OmpA-OmpF porin